MEGGLAGSIEPIGAPVGTNVRVEDLFYNVPARLKFLKQDLTERRAIDALLTRYALAYPDVRFRLLDGSSPTLQTAGDGDRRAILATLYGVEVAKQMLEVLAEDEGLRLTGFISPASLTRSNRKEITFFINGRWVSDTPLTQALLQAYHTLLMVGRYPLAALFLEIDPSEVDVNVHPAKAQVRFKNQDRVFSFVLRSTRRALLAYSPIPALPPTQNLWGSSGSGSFPQTNPAPNSVGLEWSLAHAEFENASPEAPTGSMQPVANQQTSAFNLPIMRLVGQIGATYLIAEGPDGLYLIDQHAAHERVLFEKLMAQHDQNNIPSQTLLTPQVVQVHPASAKVLEEQLPTLQHFGFTVETFGPNTFQVRAIPALFTNSDPAAALRALVEAERPHLIHADLTQDHLLGRLEGGRWTSLALIDFGDARTGSLFYELPALHFSLFGGDKRLLAAFLQGYRYAGPTGEDFACRAMACALLHQFDVFSETALHPDWRDAATLEQAANILWRVD